MDLSKAFDCIPHDLLRVKHAAYGNDDNLCFTYIPISRIVNSVVCINNVLSEFNKVISDVPQGSIVGAVLFNFFLVIFTTLLRMLLSVLESDSNIAINWCKRNNMSVNPKKKRDHTKETFQIRDKVIEVSSSVKLLGSQIDDKLNFNLPILIFTLRV